VSGVRVLVIGGGGREHALCLALARDPSVTEIVAAPGNPGIAAVARTVPLSTPLDVARDVLPDLVVIGPEAPLVGGAADELRAAGFAVFGPSAAAAAIEGSKAFAKDVMTAAGVPTAAHRVATTPAELAAALDAAGPPYVVKHDELAAGKGVVVTTDRDEALAHGAGRRVVVEDYLDGPEVSLFCLTDGATVIPLLPAQDFKRAGDGDTGPNTGGMGAYCPLPWLPPGVVDEVVKTVAVPTVEHMAARGTPFSGLLYVGLALTSAGPKVVEFNCRFGDPETQVVLALLDSPLGEVMHAVATGRLADYGPLGSKGPLRWRDGAAVVVVVASEGYPAAPVTGDVIDGVEEAGSIPGVAVLHAGTASDPDGRLVTAGGRVLGVTAVAADVASARESAYDAVRRLRIRGSHYRTDIAAAST
jgi:phosphoribosylamine--glycine ligase